MLRTRTALVAATAVLITVGAGVATATKSSHSPPPDPVPVLVTPPHPGLDHAPTAAEIARSGATMDVQPGTGAVDPGIRDASVSPTGGAATLVDTHSQPR